MGKFSNEILAYALKNAIEFGKTDTGKVLSKLFQHGLEKNQIKEVIREVAETANKVNSMNKAELEKEYGKYNEYVLEHKEKERELPELPKADKKMVFRLAPFPSGALHLGNAKTYLLNALYAEKYKAKILFIIDDTIGSEEKPIAKEAYKLIEEAFQWLKVKYSKPIIYKSDRLKIYYEYAEKLIKKDKAYVCHCSQEELRLNRANGIECACRQFPANVQLDRWREMFKMKEGKAVLRIKTDMSNPDPAFRDRVLFKISEREHPRVKKKYKVWPTLEMSWAIDDHLLGITHILRGNDLMIETQMEKYIWDILGWEHPVTEHAGMINITGMGAKLSKSKAQKEVLSGKFNGWDDPRTWSIQSLRRRGIKEESIREFVKEIGLNKHDIEVPVDSLYAINRKMIDQEADRYSFVENPVELKIENAPKIKEIEVKMHPDKEIMRKLKVGKIYISKNDFKELNGKEIRLIHLYNIKLGKKSIFTSEENKDIQKINWVSDNVKTKILMEDGTWISGIAESSAGKLKIGEVIQFERFGFCRYDKTNKGIKEFWFAHR